MPWSLRRQLILLLLGCGAIIIGSIVLILNRDNVNDLLAIGLIGGGIAILVVALPDGRNGSGKSP